jgi:hypothetical protein
MMTILAASRWNALLDCICSMKSCRLLPHNPLWERFFSGISSCIHGKLRLHSTYSMHTSFFIHPLHCTPPSSSLLMSWRCAWELAPYSTSRHTCHLIIFICFFLYAWNQHIVQSLPMDKTYKRTSMQPLVHSDCHQLPKPHVGAPCPFTMGTVHVWIWVITILLCLWVILIPYESTYL